MMDQRQATGPADPPDMSRKEAVDIAWRLLAMKAQAFEVRDIEAELNDGTWSFRFLKYPQPGRPDTGDCWSIRVSRSGPAEWSDAQK